MFRSSFIAAVGVVALAGAASAQPTTKLIAGYIVSADATARTIQVKTGADTQTYSIAESAKLEAGKSAIQAADLENAAGQRTTIWYTIDGDKRVASRLKLTETKGKSLAKGGTPAATTTTPQ